MASSLFEISWRLAILLLPWQTRWFQAGPALGGYPWEWGNVAVYASWLPMVACVALGLGIGPIGQVGPIGPMHRLRWVMPVVIISILTSVYRPATIQWWLEVGLLAAFVATLKRHVAREYLACWIVYAIIPHALLGIYQHVTDFVVGSKWFGIAAQDPLTRGASVIEADGHRYLRAYGGFPHPNIFGGWLVMGMWSLLTSPDPSLVRRGTSDSPPYQGGVRGGLLCCMLFSSALVLTFSRSAWLAFVVMMLVVGCGIRRSDSHELRRLFLAACLVMGVTMSMVMIWRFPLVMARGGAEARLEQRSTNERGQGFRNGWELFRRHPWLGVGPRATGYALVQTGLVPANSIPIIPHNVPWLALVELGVLSSVLLGLAIGPIGRIGPIGLILAPMLLLDHYLFSTWSGLTLFALTASLALWQSIHTVVSTPKQ